MRSGKVVHRLLFVALCSAVCLAGCGGGGHGGSGNDPVVVQSAGGIWHGVSTNNETLTLLVAETGDLRALETVGIAGAPPTTPPLFGSGAVLVTGDRLDGAYDTGHPFAASSGHCTFTGTVRERVSMSITLECTDDSGMKTSSAYLLSYDSSYSGASSLATVAGNYEFSLVADNFLNIDGNGVIFGHYHNGADCTVNGTVTLIDARYNLYSVEWQLSLCQAPLLQFEGATLTGFAYTTDRAAPSGSMLLFLTGPVAGNIEGLSVLYVPAQ
jgi:hypothetical protein